MASNTAVTEEGEPDVIDDDGTGQKKELVVARSATMEPIPVVSVPGGHGLDVARRRDMIQSPQGTPGRIPPFPRNAESRSSPMSERYFPEPNSTLQDLLNRSKHKAGLSVICCCTTPMTAEHIEGCTPELEKHTRTGSALCINSRQRREDWQSLTALGKELICVIYMSRHLPTRT